MEKQVKQEEADEKLKEVERKDPLRCTGSAGEVRGGRKKDASVGV